MGSPLGKKHGKSPPPPFEKGGGENNNPVLGFPPPLNKGEKNNLVFSPPFEKGGRGGICRFSQLLALSLENIAFSLRAR